MNKQPKAIFHNVPLDPVYACADGRTIKRSHKTCRWELLSDTDEVLDTDRYRHVLAARHNIQLGAE